MNNSPDDKAFEAREIRAALVAGNHRQAYRLFRPRWADALDSIPISMHGGLVRHVLAGVPTGHFLAALLTNDLMEALVRADPNSLANLRPLCLFLRNSTPPLCHGSHAKVNAWREEGGALGVYYDDADLEGAE